MKRFTTLVAASFIVAARLSTANAATIVFDDFNVNEGHFGFAPSFSATSVGEDATSTADRVTTDSPLEGAGHQKLVLVHDATTTALRIRHLSGGPPYNTANAGTPVGNTGFSFTTGAGTDGWIGFYLKTTATGWQTSINLDGPTGATAEMDGSASLPIIADGAWHLYEWNLDAVSGWGAVPGIGGGHGGAVANGSHTIDSIYFRDLDGTPGPTGTFFLDFVAKSDSGSIAGLLNSPPTVVDTVIGPPYNANEPGAPQTLTHQFTATDTETPAGPFTWDMLSLVSYTPNYGGAGLGPALAASLSGSGQFDWVSEGSPRGDYVWKVRGTDPGGLSDEGTITVHVTEVPEPTTLAMCGLALMGVVGLFRRR